MTKNNNVNHPPHYTGSNGIECWDAIKASMSPEEFKGFLKGNAIKYLWRYRLKGKPLEDLEKAIFYITKLEYEFKEKDTVEKILEEMEGKK